MSKRPQRSRRGPKKAKKVLSSGQIHVYATFNNTIITVTDQQGNTVTWSSAGAVGFKGGRKSTPFAARLAMEKALKSADTRPHNRIRYLKNNPRDAFIYSEIMTPKYF